MVSRLVVVLSSTRVFYIVFGRKKLFDLIGKRGEEKSSPADIEVDPVEEATTKNNFSVSRVMNNLRPVCRLKIK